MVLSRLYRVELLLLGVMLMMPYYVVVTTTPSGTSVYLLALAWEAGSSPLHGTVPSHRYPVFPPVTLAAMVLVLPLYFIVREVRAPPHESLGTTAVIVSTVLWTVVLAVVPRPLYCDGFAVLPLAEYWVVLPDYAALLTAVTVVTPTLLRLGARVSEAELGPVLPEQSAPPEWMERLRRRGVYVLVAVMMIVPDFLSSAYGSTVTGEHGHLTEMAALTWTLSVQSMMTSQGQVTVWLLTLGPAVAMPATVLRWGLYAAVVRETVLCTKGESSVIRVVGLVSLSVLVQVASSLAYSTPSGSGQLMVRPVPLPALQAAALFMAGLVLYVRWKTKRATGNDVVEVVVPWGLLVKSWCRRLRHRVKEHAEARHDAREHNRDSHDDDGQ